MKTKPVQPLDRPVQVYVSEGQYDVLDRAAHKARQTLSAWARQTLLEEAAVALGDAGAPLKPAVDPQDEAEAEWLSRLPEAAR